MLGSKQLKRT